MNDLRVFKNDDFGEVRTSLINDQPYFCLSDVCRILDIKNASDSKKRLKQRGIATVYTPTGSGSQPMLFIDEPNLYRCIFQSRKPEAEKFQDWVTEEVLPEIRKTGSYKGIPKSFSEALYFAYEQQKKIEELERTKAWIGSRREATAMNTASQKAKEVKKLQAELGLRKTHASIKCVEKLTKQKYDWRKLKDYCVKHNLKWDKVGDVNYGSVNVYPAEAWMNVYGVDLAELVDKVESGFYEKT